MKKTKLAQVKAPTRHHQSRSNKQNYTHKTSDMQTKNYLNVMNKNNSLVLLESDRFPSRNKLHVLSCNSASKRKQNLNRQNSSQATLQLPKIQRYKCNKVPPIHFPQNSCNIKQMITKIFDQKKNQMTIQQQFSKLNHLTKRYSLLRKDLVTIQQNIITMNLRSAQRY